MQHIDDPRSLHLDACGLTIGSFDGVHLGHQQLIGSMVQFCRRSNLPAVVLTFFPHPGIVLRGHRPSYYLTSPEDKALLLAELGVSMLITETFDAQLSRLSAAEYLDLLRERLQFQDLWISDSFTMGKNREGDRSFLAKRAASKGFRLHIVPPKLVDGEAVSSTRVREALRAGDVDLVARLLGRPYAVPGIVVKGAGRGRGLGKPTANLRIWEEQAFPKAGVYAAWAEVQEQSWPAVVNIGVRPTFEEKKGPAVIEAHLLGFAGNLYGEQMRLAFVERLRDEKRFPSAEALMAQMDRDIRRAEKVLYRSKEHADA
jgi:riboflavin kinase/FMN adenylyltransferase